MTMTPRQRVPAAQRRDALIDAAVEEFAQGGLHATPVGRIARRVGVAQPYVFSLFPTKRDLFIAAVERGFQRVTEHFMAQPPTLEAIGGSYAGLLAADRSLLTLQLHGYAAACEDEVIAAHVRGAYAALVSRVRDATDASPGELQQFMARGMWLTVQAAMGVQDPGGDCGRPRPGDLAGLGRGTAGQAGCRDGARGTSARETRMGSPDGGHPGTPSGGKPCRLNAIPGPGVTDWLNISPSVPYYRP
jgi:AcrR family transcriptional regulator